MTSHPVALLCVLIGSYWVRPVCFEVGEPIKIKSTVPTTTCSQVRSGQVAQLAELYQNRVRLREELLLVQEKVIPPPPLPPPPLLSLSGIIFPSLSSLLYLVCFQVLCTWWAWSGQVPPFLFRCVSMTSLLYSSSHFLLVYCYQLPSLQEAWPSNRTSARYHSSNR